MEKTYTRSAVHNYFYDPNLDAATLDLQVMKLRAQDNQANGESAVIHFHWHTAQCMNRDHEYFTKEVAVDG